MTITDEHFDVLQELRVEARNLQLACIERTGNGALIHMSFDPTITPRTSEREAASLKKLRLVK